MKNYSNTYRINIKKKAISNIQWNIAFLLHLLSYAYLENIQVDVTVVIIEEKVDDFTDMLAFALSNLCYCICTRYLLCQQTTKKNDRIYIIMMTKLRPIPLCTLNNVWNRGFL